MKIQSSYNKLQNETLGTRLSITIPVTHVHTEVHDTHACPHALIHVTAMPSLSDMDRNYMSTTLKGLKCHPPYSGRNQPASVMDAGRRLEPPGSETTQLIAHSHSRSIIISASVPAPHVTWDDGKKVR